jgi:hypothetical protein
MGVEHVTEKVIESWLSISKSVTNDIRVSQLVIAKMKFRSVSPARKLRSVSSFPHISPWEMSHARPVLHTVFSTAQLGHLITKLVFLRSQIMKGFHSSDPRSQT